MKGNASETHAVLVEQDCFDRGFAFGECGTEGVE